MRERPAPASQTTPEAIPRAMPVRGKYLTDRDPVKGGKEPQKPKSTRTKFALVAIAALLATAIGIGEFFGGGAHSDQPTRVQLEEMQRSWETVQKSGVILSEVQREEIAQAIATINLPEEERIALQREVESDRVSLVWITVWDSMAEDGDVITLSSNGLTITAPLYSKMHRIAVPRPSDGVVHVTGVQDGQGGITLGLMSGPNLVLIPPLSVGQSVGIPVR